MRRKLMLLSALTCIAGGTTLLAPASAQSRDELCDGLVGMQCSGSGGYTSCTSKWGTTEYLQCFNGTWHYA